jgi:hypothetical protein
LAVTPSNRSRVDRLGQIGGQAFVHSVSWPGACRAR